MKKVVFGTIFTFLIFLGSTSILFAQNGTSIPFRQGEHITLEAGEVVDRDFFATGEKVEIRGTVNGDLYAAGGNVVIEGSVKGDVLVAGGQIDILGDVVGNIRAIGGNVELYGNVGKNLTVVGGNIEINNSATVGGSTVFGAGNVELAGPVAGNVAGGIGSLVISNRVGGNIYAGVGQLYLENGASIAGDVLYWSKEAAFVDTTATVSGTLEHRVPVDSSPQPDRETVEAARTGIRLFSLFSTIAIGLLMLRFFPGLLETGARFIDQKPWQSLGFGFLKLILEPIIALILMATIIGFPIGVFLIFAYIIELYFASYMVAYWIGRLIWNKFNKKENRYWAFILGALIFGVIVSVPIVSGIIRFFSLLFGLGAILLLKWSWYKKTFAKGK